MGEHTRDKRSPTTESTKNKQKTQGWIRIHSDESTTTHQVDNPQDEEPRDIVSQALSDKVRKLEKPVE